MLNFNQFLESKEPETNRVQAIMTIAGAIQTAFKKLSRARRKGVWKALNSAEGKKEIADLINNPDRSIVRFRLLSFKESP